MAKCKHEYGWGTLRDVSIFVKENGEVSINHCFPGGIVKLKMKCNIIGCPATRNMYLEGTLVKMGVIKRTRLYGLDHFPNKKQ